MTHHTINLSLIVNFAYQVYMSIVYFHKKLHKVRVILDISFRHNIWTGTWIAIMLCYLTSIIVRIYVFYYIVDDFVWKINDEDPHNGWELVQKYMQDSEGMGHSYSQPFWWGLAYTLNQVGSIKHTLQYIQLHHKKTLYTT